MKDRLQIRDIAAAGGQKAQGFLTIGETPCGTLQVPVVIINGREDGPVLCLTAGVHATEYAPIDAVMQLVRQLEPGHLRGAVVAVPVANMRMFESRMGFVSPLDGLNLNKIAPGSTDGSISEMLAHVLLDEIIGIAQYHIDLHAGDLGELLLPFAGYAMTGDRDLDRDGEALVRAYTPRLVSLAEDHSTVPPFPGSLVYAATRRGVVSILAEAGGNGTLEDDDTQVHLRGVRNAMRYLNMIDGEPSISAPQVVARDRIVVRAKKAGLLRLKVEIGDEIAAGQEVAEVYNVFGETVERVQAPGAGVIGLIWTHKVVNTGDPVVRNWITERG